MPEHVAGSPHTHPFRRKKKRSVAVEVFLHASWEYGWWNIPSPRSIVILGYLWFYLYAAWVYDAPSARERWSRLGGLAAINLAMGLAFGVGFG